MRTGLFTALAIGIHNFPEGLATFGTALGDIRLGIVIAIAIAIHNIPEGTLYRFLYFMPQSKSLHIPFLSGLAEPLEQ